jgi:hypothetical protein
MNKPRRAIVLQRVPVFIGCEGQSERGYAGLLMKIIRQGQLSFHLHIEDLGLGSGDPHARIQKAAKKIKHTEERRTRFAGRFVLLDKDQAEMDPQKAQSAQNLAQQKGISIIWQDPCFEAVLLRHLPNCSTRRPATTQIAKDDLVKEWPDYNKGMPTASLEKRIDTAALARVATVEPALGALLRFLKLI